MADTAATGQTMRQVERLRDAMNDHDLDALVGAFADDYVVEMPVHPRRSFSGAEQVRRNWTQILATVPDLSTRIVGVAIDGDTAWAEWDWTGTRLDGGLHHLRGITILGTRGDRIAWSRFYMEPVEADGAAIDESIRATLSGAGTTS